jgi:hypothetical protein
VDIRGRGPERVDILRMAPTRTPPPSPRDWLAPSPSLQILDIRHGSPLAGVAQSRQPDDTTGHGLCQWVISPIAKIVPALADTVLMSIGQGDLSRKCHGMNLAVHILLSGYSPVVHAAAQDRSHGPKFRTRRDVQYLAGSRLVPQSWGNAPKSVKPFDSR